MYYKHLCSVSLSISTELDVTAPCECLGRVVWGARGKSESQCVLISFACFHLSKAVLEKAAHLNATVTYLKQSSNDTLIHHSLIGIKIYGFFLTHFIPVFIFFYFFFIQYISVWVSFSANITKPFSNLSLSTSSTIQSNLDRSIIFFQPLHKLFHLEMYQVTDTK